MRFTNWFHMVCMCVMNTSGNLLSTFQRITVDTSSVNNGTRTTTAVSSLVHCAGLCNVDESCKSFLLNQSMTCKKLNPFLLYNTGSAATTDVYLEVAEPPNIGDILVVGGTLTLNGQVTSDVEIINPNSSNSSCTKPPNYPLALMAYSGGMIMGNFVACGGYSSGNDYSSCYMHNSSGKNWQLFPPLPQKARHAKSTSIGNLFLTTGGTYVSSSLDNSQAFSLGKGYVSFTALPFILCRHCMANINSTHVFLVGGSRYNGDLDVQNALILSVPSQQYNMLPNLDQTRMDAFCGVITRLNGVSELVIAGGSSDSIGSSVIISTRIYSFSTNSWQTGPNLPSAMSGGGSVQYGRNTFLIIHYKGIYKYDVVNDGWITLPGKMKTPRRWFAFALVPPDYVQCS